MAEERKEMTIKERIDTFIEIQQMIANTLGLAVPVQHGEMFPLYDIWGHKLMNLKIHTGTEIKKEDGEITVTQFNDRGK